MQIGVEDDLNSLTNEDAILKDYIDRDITSLCQQYRNKNPLNFNAIQGDNIKRGLRNADGTGVVVGVTSVCNVHGYVMDEGERSPVEGQLTYRGYDVSDIVASCIAENRYGFEEVVWLLLCGFLPTRDQLEEFNRLLAKARRLPENFVEDMIFKAPSPNIMNKLERAVLALYSFDCDPDNCSLENVMRQSIELIARMPMIMANAYQVKRRAYDGKSMYIHLPKEEYSTAQNILRTMRPDKSFTEEEAHLLDICLILHAEHGGGNNSTFATRVLSSSGTDTYSAIAAGIGALKGPRHGGANKKVMEQLAALKEAAPLGLDSEVETYIRKALEKEAGDGSGLIYGMGHAVYTKSDPRAVILKRAAKKMVMGTALEPDFLLLDAIERLTPAIMAERGNPKPICANVDLYSGLVYEMLGFPEEVNTPLFAVARTAGWCAHRMEEIATCNRIIRPAYRPFRTQREYLPLDRRS